MISNKNLLLSNCYIQSSITQLTYLKTLYRLDNQTVTRVPRVRKFWCSKSYTGQILYSVENGSSPLQTST